MFYPPLARNDTHHVLQPSLHQHRGKSGHIATIVRRLTKTSAVYAPAQIVRDARAYDVKIRPIDVNTGRWDCTLEGANGEYKAVRLGLRMVRDLPNADGAAIVAARSDTPYASLEEIQRG
ncbi:hypothetical protein CVN68_09665 [Sphingomonas psychrotolerans]|uniref:DNA polymerase helix-hairpin-helix motif domain-containing protein n=1 Tax=Sphingomonas psychrotolerans TaxID=1327635 RepID=A0A2K8MLX3_9SPHN|nr:hypothetical protein CVN68_09665 [Sphingomonas psychrotolerans]